MPDRKCSLKSSAHFGLFSSMRWIFINLYLFGKLCLKPQISSDKMQPFFTPLRDLDRFFMDSSLQKQATPNVLIEEIHRSDPYKYKNNNKRQKDVELERRINKVLTEFIQKYMDNGRSDIVDVLVEKVMKIRKGELWAKGFRECVAVVFFIECKEQLGLMKPSFCKENQLNVKFFNQKYKAYQKLFPKIQAPAPQLSPVSRFLVPAIKVEYKGDDDKQYKNQSFEQDLSDVRQIKVSTILESEEEECRRSMEVIFDDIFRRAGLRRSKELLITKIVHRVMQVRTAMRESLNSQQSWPKIVFYLIFGVLQYFGHKFLFSVFKKIVKKRAALDLNKQKAVAIMKIYSQYQQNRENSSFPSDSDPDQQRSIPESSSLIHRDFLVMGVKQEDRNYSNIQFKIMQSPVVMQQQYFSFQNYYYFPNDSYN